MYSIIEIQLIETEGTKANLPARSKAKTIIHERHWSAKKMGTEALQLLSRFFTERIWYRI
jgi:hypothetical protein